MNREVCAAVPSVIALTGVGFTPSASADRGHHQHDQAGFGTVGLDPDIDAHQPNGAGNQDILSHDLRDLVSNVAGRASSSCITTSPFIGDPDRPLLQHGVNLCTTWYVLKDGKIIVRGIVTDDDFKPGVLTIPIVGGTGKDLLSTLPLTR